MSLEELNEQLHSRDAHFERTRSTTPYQPGEGSGNPETKEAFIAEETWKAVPKVAEDQGLTFVNTAARRHKKMIALALGGLAGLVLLGGLAYKVHDMLFSQERISVALSGPKSVASAELTTFTFSYANKNWGALNDALLVVTYPDAFHPDQDGQMKVNGLRAEIPIGRIGANAEGKVTLSGKFYGSKNDLIYLKGTLRYTPNNVTSTFESTTQLGVNIASSPLSIAITAPQEQASGQDIIYVVDYGNDGDLKFSNLRLKLEYPDGFHFVTAEPRPSEGDSVWYLGALDGNVAGKITVHGTMVGGNDEFKKVRGLIGYLQGDGNFIAYNIDERQTKVVASPLSIYQTVNGLADVNVNPGDVLRYSIKYRNNGAVGLRDVIVLLELDSPYLDFSRLLFTTRGAYDASRKLLIWKASDVPRLAELEPGESGEINFTIPVVGKIALSGADKSISIRSLAKIDSPDVPTPIGSNKIFGSNTLFVKLNALVALDVKGYYQDTTIANTGPIPPIVGQETTYTLHLSLSNSSNDVTNARVVVALPTGVTFKGKNLPESETVVFNDRSNELSWDLGTLIPGKTGRSIAFQIGVIPDVSQVGDNYGVTLVNNVIFTGKDSFTGQDVRVELGAKSNSLPEDPSVGSDGFVVRTAP